MADSRDESDRLAALAACAVMDTPREGAFDCIVFTVAQLFRVPMALLALVDDSRVWAKASVGPISRDIARSKSLCTAVVEGKTLIVAEDATVDPRFASQAAVAPQDRIRFFAGAPLKGPDDYVVGALCVFDHHTRTVPERQQAQLLQFAAQTSELLRSRIAGGIRPG